MIFAKNYETMSEFVEVMPEKMWPLFSGHGEINFGHNMYVQLVD